MMKDSSLCVRMPAALKEQFSAYCRNNGQSPSTTIRKVAAHLLGNSQKKETPPSTSQDEPDLGRRRIEIRLSHSELELLQSIATDHGSSPNKWICDLIRAHLSRQPQLGLRELMIVGESNRNLRALGRNLNQIARQAHREGLPASTYERIGATYQLIDKHTQEVHQIIQSNLKRWRLT